MRLGRVGAAATVLLIVTGLMLGLVTGTFAALGRSGLYATGLWRDGGAATLSPGALDAPATPPSRASRPPSPNPSTAPGLPSPILQAATPTAGPRPAKVAAAIAEIDSTGVRRFGGSILDAGTGRAVYRHEAGRGLIPASTTKLLTSAAALSILGPHRTFATTVVRAPRNRIVLVGGGDPYLTKKPSRGRASLAALAQATASRLGSHRKVALAYDESLFTGPSWHPDWPAAYGDQVSKISALWVDEGRLTGVSPGPRVADPAKAAADAFAAALRREGVAVTRVAPARAPRGAPVLATVRSWPLERIVEALLMVSDNDAAEVVFRQAALGARQPGSFTGGRRAVQSRLRSLGVPAAGVVDGSGLSRETRVPAESLTQLLRISMTDRHPELRAVVTGLPVAGVEGSLRSRFFDDQSLSGRGLVRAKTGTLRKVHTLAGYVRSTDGSVLVFAFLVNDPKNEYAARVWLDRVSTALSRCGCR